MAVFNEILSGRFNRALQKITSIKGPPPVPQLAGEIVPSFPLFWGRECRYLESWNTYGAAGTAAAVAAQVSNIKLRNPAGSNVVLVVEKLTIFEAAADTIGLSAQNTDTDLAGVIGGTSLDLRNKSQGVAKFSTGNNVATSAGWARAFLQANIPLEFIGTDIQEFPILPGDSLLLITGSVNVSLQVSMMWRERFLEDSERS